MFEKEKTENMSLLHAMNFLGIAYEIYGKFLCILWSAVTKFARTKLDGAEFQARTHAHAHTRARAYTYIYTYIYIKGTSSSGSGAKLFC